MNQRQILSWALPTSSTTGAAQATLDKSTWSHQLIVTGTGSVSGAAVVEGTNDPAGVNGWQTIATLTAGAASGVSSDAIVVQHSWAQIRARSTALTGTGAAAVVNSSGA